MNIKTKDKPINLIKPTLVIAILWVFSFYVKAENSPLTVICDEWPPYQTVEKNNVGGFSTKVVEEVFKRMNVKTNKIKAYPWKRAITMVKTGTADALFSANFTEERTKFAIYPEETLVDSPWVMWVREEDNLKYESFDNLLGKKVGLVRGYSYTKDLWEFVKKHNIYEEVTKDEQNFKKLNSGRIDYAAAELGNGFYIIKNLKLNKIVPLKGTPIKSSGLYIMFNNKNVSKKFVDNFSKELKKLKTESVYKFLYNEYFGS
ncbi:substrate-binding periplasmic protein [Zooshikella sp. RANM57]|uniref:substrate-binding periplasmic protein n=1 Tax=Zooshikella sp. RANM57 TaxID=3425863 RepID=UPI003D6DDEB0